MPNTKLTVVTLLMFMVCVLGSMSDLVASGSLYTDLKARGVGDIVTVVITEKTLATNSSKISTGKETKFSTEGENGTGAFDFLTGFSMSANIGREHEGAGTTERTGSILGKMAAVVTEVTAGGNLVIKGEKEIAVNDEKEILVLTGIVRPQDISTNNIVYSTDIASTQITYKGKGLITSGSKPSIFARIIGWFF
jgi:flagellar L-ring protein precursor FlgH